MLCKNIGLNWLIWLGLPVPLLLLLTAVADASETARIIAVDGCKARIRGGDFRAGDELVFLVLYRGRQMLVNVDVEKGKKGKAEGRIRDKRKCRLAQGARHSPNRSEEQLKELFLYRQSLLFGIHNVTQKGLNMILPSSEQNLPVFWVVASRLTLFPLVTVERGFFGRSLGFDVEVQSSLPVQDQWEVDDGGQIGASLLDLSGGLLLRPYLLGAAHPTEIQVGYASRSLNFELQQQKVYTKSVFRPVDCGGLLLSLNQNVSVSSSFSLRIGGWISPLESCSSPEIDEAASLEIVEQQQSLGIAEDQRVPAVEIESAPGLIEPQSFGVRASAHLEFSEILGLEIVYDMRWFNSKIQHIESQKELKMRNSSLVGGLWLAL